MSPLAIFYMLLASPMFGGRFHDMENSWSTPSWTPESMNWSPESWSHWNTESSMTPFNTESMTPFNWSPEWSNWNTESSMTPFNTESMTPFSTYESTYPSTHGLNWLLRKAIRASTSRRSIVRELTGLETPFAAYTPVERMLSKVHLIRRIAEVNPIMIEKILSCPKTRFAVETILRTAEPETLLLVEKLIRKNIPSYLIKDVTRRIAKNLIHSSKYSKRSIISELYPTSELFHSYESPIFSNDFESIFSTRSAKKDSIRRLIKSVAGVYHPESKIFSEDSFESVFSPLSSKHSIRRLIKSEKVEKTILKKLIKSVLRHETPLLSTVSPKMMEKSIRKLVKKIVKVNRFDFDTTSTKVHFCHFCNTVCESTLYTVSPICNKCNVVCGEHDNVFSNNVFAKLF